jgi:hypothetical protein
MSGKELCYLAGKENLMKKLFILLVLVSVAGIVFGQSAADIRKLRKTPVPERVPSTPPEVPANVVVLDGSVQDAMRFNKGVLTSRLRGIDSNPVVVESTLTTTNGAPLTIDASVDATGGIKSQGEDVIHTGLANIPNGYLKLNESGQIDVEFVPTIHVYFSGGHATE